MENAAVTVSTWARCHSYQPIYTYTQAWTHTHTHTVQCIHMYTHIWQGKGEDYTRMLSILSHSDSYFMLLDYQHSLRMCVCLCVCASVCNSVKVAIKQASCFPISHGATDYFMAPHLLFVASVCERAHPLKIICLLLHDYMCKCVSVCMHVFGRAWSRPWWVPRHRMS